MPIGAQPFNSWLFTHDASTRETAWDARSLHRARTVCPNDVAISWAGAGPHRGPGPGPERHRVFGLGAWGLLAGRARGPDAAGGGRLVLAFVRRDGGGVDRGRCLGRVERKCQRRGRSQRRSVALDHHANHSGLALHPAAPLGHRDGAAVPACGAGVVLWNMGGRGDCHRHHAVGRVQGPAGQLSGLCAERNVQLQPRGHHSVLPHDRGHGGHHLQEWGDPRHRGAPDGVGERLEAGTDGDRGAGREHLLRRLRQYPHRGQHHASGHGPASHFP